MNTIKKKKNDYPRCLISPQCQFVWSNHLIYYLLSKYLVTVCAHCE